MAGLWQAHEPELTELGYRAELAMRFSWVSGVWVDVARHDPDVCACYLLPVFFNHVEREGEPCGCSGCELVRERWKGNGNG